MEPDVYTWRSHELHESAWTPGWVPAGWVHVHGHIHQERSSTDERHINVSVDVGGPAELADQQQRRITGCEQRARGAAPPQPAVPG